MITSLCPKSLITSISLEFIPFQRQPFHTISSSYTGHKTLKQHLYRSITSLFYNSNIAWHLGTLLLNPAKCYPLLFTHCEYWSFRYCLNPQSNSEWSKLLLHLHSYEVYITHALLHPFQTTPQSYLTSTRFLVPSKHLARQKSNPDYNLN